MSTLDSTAPKQSSADSFTDELLRSDGDSTLIVDRYHTRTSSRSPTSI